jgi:nicotinamide mononucleotide transporter PnuC
MRRSEYFTTGEILLWSCSVIFIVLSFCIFDRENYPTLAASLVGATALIFLAKGNPIGQLLTIVFSILYGVISYTFSYYGEMVTYLGMTAPMALCALISWLKNPYNGNRSEVKVNHLQIREWGFLSILTVAVTIVFFFVLRFFQTANLLPSTLSVSTSFLAVYLTFRRSPYYALAYAVNDIILIILWSLATRTDQSYLSVVICFLMFFANDIYGFINWTKMKKRQENKGV